MIGTVAIFLAMHGGPLPLVQQSGGQVVSKVFLRYARAQTLSGTIVQTTSDGAGTITVKTNVSFVRPAKLYIEQNRKAKNGLNLLVVSDGERFTYDHPRGTLKIVPPGDRLGEPVSGKYPFTEEPFSRVIGEMYAIAHSSLEPVTALDIAIAYSPHLADLTTNVATVVLSGSVLYKGRQVYRVTGTWRRYKNEIPSGNYEMLVSSEYDILKFTLTEQYMVRGRLVKATVIETVDIKVGTKVDDTVFKVR
ncbi:MAG: hypothetical protein IH945_03390 [Armatimonadetes bacterium]|nr:hypothetical protein [Armatimonadota bacterium]